jgi:hypothetical protein
MKKVKSEKVKKVLVGLALCSVVSISAATAFGQPTRIKFKRGAASAVVTAPLTGFRSSKTYVIRVRSGQTLTTESAGTNPITVEITAPRGSTYQPDLAADCHDRHEVSPTAAGDYRIKVTECRKADPYRGRFRLKVTVR